MSEGVTENGILPEKEYEEYHAKTSRYRFMNQMFLGIGGAMVFGLVAAVGQNLFAIAGPAIGQALGLSVTTGVGLAIGGLGILAVAGIACIYMGSKYLTKNIILDQDFQAKKIGLAASGKVPEIQLIPDQGRPVLPTGMQTMAQLDQAPESEAAPETVQPTTRWTDQILPTAARAPVADLARSDAQTWAERSATSPEAPQALRA